MVRHSTIRLAAAALGLAAPAAAQTNPAAPAAPVLPTRVTAKALTAVCGENREACLTYVLGAVDAFGAAVALARGRKAYCIPMGTTNDQLAQAAVRYLRAHPEEGNVNAATVVIAGLASAYPCGY